MIAMKVLKYFILVMLILICLGALYVFILFLLRESICEGKLLASDRTLVEFLFPPKNLYDKIIDAEIQLDKGKEYCYSINCRYVGRYVFGIALDKWNEELFFNKNALDLILKLDFYTNKQMLTKTTSSIHYAYPSNPQGYAAYSNGKNGGFILGRIEVPKELENSINTNLTVTVVNADEKLGHTYGPIRFFIKRTSEY